MDTRLIRIKTMGILLTLAAACATTDPGEQGRMLVDGIRGSDIEMVRQAPRWSECSHQGGREKIPAPSRGPCRPQGLKPDCS